MTAWIYVRGSAVVSAGWAEGGAEGWGYADVLPFFERAEDQARGKLPGHGVGGPLRVEDLACKNPLSAAFIDACVEAGTERNPHLNAPQQDRAAFSHITPRNAPPP